MSGKQIAKLIEDWVEEQGIHPDDFHSLFAHELLDKLEEDE